MRFIRRFACVLFVAAAAVTLGGCRPDVTITLNAPEVDGTQPSVEVHIIGVRTAGEYRRLRDVAISNYDWVRARADEKTYVMQLGEGLPNPQTLTTKDPIWSKWDGPKQLIVISSYPSGDDLPGMADPRRLILPLKWNSWSGKLIPIVIKPTGLVCETGYKPWNPFED